MKGQSSLELFVSLGVVLAFTIPVILLLLSVTSIGYEDTARVQADAAARTLADNINSAYAQGPGARREMLLNVPPSTESIKVAGGEVVVSIMTSGGRFDAAAPIIAAMSGPQSIDAKSGLFKVVVSTRGTGEVELSAQ